MNTLTNKLKAHAIARELCATPEDAQIFVNLALALERKLANKDLDEERAIKIARLIRERNKAMAAELDRVAQAIHMRKLAKAIAQQDQNNLYKMVIITILMIWLEPPKNTLKPSF
ncbi:hypothetical protein ACQKPX_24750 [Photobacterium sp. DNB23_23_1]